MRNPFPIEKRRRGRAFGFWKAPCTDFSGLRRAVFVYIGSNSYHCVRRAALETSEAALFCPAFARSEPKAQRYSLQPLWTRIAFALREGARVLRAMLPDLDNYRCDVDHFDLTPDQKDELMLIVWRMMESAVYDSFEHQPERPARASLDFGAASEAQVQFDFRKELSESFRHQAGVRDGD